MRPAEPPPPGCHSETYEYYKLPYCKPKDGVKWKTLGMGEVVDANRMASTPYQLSFRTDRKDEVVCEKTLSQDDLSVFRKVGGGGGGGDGGGGGARAALRCAQHRLLALAGPPAGA